jgi:hypothetical protein
MQKGKNMGIMTTLKKTYPRKAPPRGGANLHSPDGSRPSTVAVQFFSRFYAFMTQHPAIVEEQRVRLVAEYQAVVPQMAAGRRHECGWLGRKKNLVSMATPPQKIGGGWRGMPPRGWIRHPCTPMDLESSPVLTASDGLFIICVI